MIATPPARLFDDLAAEIEYQRNAQALGQPVFVDTLIDIAERAVRECKVAQAQVDEYRDGDEYKALLKVRRILQSSKRTTHAMKQAINEAIEAANNALD